MPDNAPDQGVVFVNKAGYRQDRHGLGEYQDHGFKQEGEATVGSGPGNVHAANTALPALDAGCTGVQKCLVLEEVQVPPGQGTGVIGLAGQAAMGAGKQTAARDIQMDVQASPSLIESTAFDFPRREQTQCYLK